MGLTFILVSFVMQSAENFAQMAHQYNVTLSFVGRLSLDLRVTFEELIRTDSKVIIGMFGSSYAKSVLCQVRTQL